MKAIKISLFAVLLAMSTNTFSQVQHNTSLNPFVLCENTFTLEQFEANYSGKLDLSNTCLDHVEQLSTVWLEFEVTTPAVLSMAITPLNSHEDMDFVLFEVSYEHPGHYDAIPIRCVATGLNLGQSRASQSNCTGATGMFENAHDILETSGCDSHKDNFVEAHLTQPNRKYLLLVTSFNATAGFELSINEDLQVKRASDCEGAVNSTLPGEASVRLGRLFPNPSSQNTHIEIFSPTNTEVVVSISNAQGQIVQQQAIGIASGSSIIALSTNTLPVGWYSVSFEGTTNKFIETRSLSIAR